jgi:hypothetical protein
MGTPSGSCRRPITLIVDFSLAQRRVRRKTHGRPAVISAPMSENEDAAGDAQGLLDVIAYDAEIRPRFCGGCPLLALGGSGERPIGLEHVGSLLQMTKCLPHPLLIELQKRVRDFWPEALINIVLKAVWSSA